MYVCRGQTPLAWAAAHGLTQMVQLLVHMGADLLTTDLHGQVPRQLAYKNNHRATADVLSSMARARLIGDDPVSGEHSECDVC